MAPDLRSLARAWLAGDPDPETQAELRELLARDDDAALLDRFGARLEFGTAGLRGVFGAGTNRINRAIVIQTTAGLAAYLLTERKDARERGVVVGYDGRKLSRELAEDTACVLAAAGIVAHLFPMLGPTPLTAYAVSDLGAAGGVMVTASHNPPEYNGYKVYWGNGAQIIPPHDGGIARAIDAVGPANRVPRLPLAEARAKGLVRDVPADVEARYLAKVEALCAKREVRPGLRIVYTPLHGAGGRLAKAAFLRTGFDDVHVVPEQAEPDGAFPTVAFPNPEEKGAMDLSLALANEVGAELVLANDPDADRLAVAVPDGRGGFLQLTGNEVGVLLGHYLLTEGEPGANRLVISTIVSSPMLARIAASSGTSYDETLTGFKWIANRAMELARAEKKRFVFGYEEALGYSVGELVRDKDGISAACLFAELASVAKSRGRSVLDELEAIARRHGLYVSSQRSVTIKGVDGPAKIAEFMRGLRAAMPKAIGGHAVVATRDYAARTRTTAGGEVTNLTLPASNVLAFELEGGGRVVVRPSGTEPKIKFYFDHREPVAAGEPLEAVRRRAAAVIEGMETFARV